MTATIKDLDLSTLPPEYRVAFEAQAAPVAELEDINRRQEHLIAVTAPRQFFSHRPAPFHELLSILVDVSQVILRRLRR